MQDRYVGDVGDFAKYALLRRIAGQPRERAITLGVVWCSFPDETHNNDGGHISYLDKIEYEALDDSLLFALRKIVRSGQRRISAVTEGSVLPKGTAFWNASLSALKALRLSRADRIQHRGNQLHRCLRTTAGRDLIFFDPDNGIQVASIPKHHPKSGKYIYWDELMPFWDREQVLLIYHHLNRTMSAGRQVGALRERFQTALHNAIALPLVFRRGSCRTFWLIYRQSDLGTELERRVCDFVNSGWSRHFRPLGWPDDDQIAMR
jgi:hypothetical protein